MDITIGRYNEIPEGTFIPFKGEDAGPVVVGDCNFIGEGTRILVGPEGFVMKDYNVVHNHTTIGGPGLCTIGHNCWFGQENWLDSSGGLTIGNGVRIGLRSHIWSHMASGEQIEGWPVVFRPTELKDGVWLIGDDVHVASGVTMHENSCALAHSTITKDCKADTVYSGTPAKPMYMRIRREVTIEEKWKMMRRWTIEFCNIYGAKALVFDDGVIMIYIDRGKPLLERILITIGKFDDDSEDENATYFDLVTKTYTKRLTQLERDFINFLKGNKARFLPIE